MAHNETNPSRRCVRCRRTTEDAPGDRAAFGAATRYGPRVVCVSCEAELAKPLDDVEAYVRLGDRHPLRGAAHYQHPPGPAHCHTCGGDVDEDGRCQQSCDAVDE